MENISKVKVYGKAKNRTVLGIVNAYLVLNPKTTAEQLREVFSTARFAKGKWAEKNKAKDPWAAEGFFHEIVVENGSRRWASTGARVEVTTIQFEQESEVIHTVDGKTLAMESIWPQEDYQEMVEYVKQFGIEVASLESTSKAFERGSFRLEYLNGFDPSTLIDVPEPEPEPVPQKETIIEKQPTHAPEPAAEQPPHEEEDKKCCNILCLLLWVLVGLMLIFLIYLLATNKSIADRPTDNGAQQEVALPIEVPEPVLAPDTLATDSLPTDSLQSDTIAPDTAVHIPAFVAKETVEAVQHIQKKFNAAKFVKGKTDLSDETKAVLDELADVLKQNPKAKMKVVGYASPEGDERFNQYLSEKRAKAVVSYLVSAGVPASQLSSEGKGASDQVSDNPDDNRRTEFVWVD